MGKSIRYNNTSKQGDTHQSDRAVSTVIGVVLLVGVTLVLTTVIGAMAMSNTPSDGSMPTVHLDAEYTCNNFNSNPDRLLITHREGDTIEGSLILAFTNASGQRVERALTDQELTAGDFLIVEKLEESGVERDTTVALLEGSSKGSSNLIHSWEISAIATGSLRCLEDSGSTPTPTATPTPTPVPNSPPRADFQWTRKGKSSNVDLDAGPSSDPDGSIATYEWDKNDDGTIDRTGATWDGATIPCGASVRLTVEDTDGATDDVVKTIGGC